MGNTTGWRIATELDCSLKTVEHHVSSILRKVDVENRASLIFALLGDGAPAHHGLTR